MDVLVPYASFDVFLCHICEALMCLDELATMASGGDCIFDCGKDHHPSLFGRHHWPGSMPPAGKAGKFNPQVLFLEDKLGNNLMRKKDSCGFRHSTHVSDSSAGIFRTYWSILIEKIWRCRVQRAKDLNCWVSSLSVGGMWCVNLCHYAWIVLKTFGGVQSGSIPHSSHLSLGLAPLQQQRHQEPLRSILATVGAFASLGFIQCRTFSFILVQWKRSEKSIGYIRYREYERTKILDSQESLGSVVIIWWES